MLAVLATTVSPAKAHWWLIHVNRHCENIKQNTLNKMRKMP
jgi:hypothetical protein